MAVGGGFNVANHLPMAVSMNEPHKLTIDCQNGDDIAVHLGTPNTTDKSGDSELQETGGSDFGLETRVMPECGDAQQLISVGELERSNEEVNLSESLNVTVILKKVLLCVYVCALEHSIVFFLLISSFVAFNCTISNIYLSSSLL